MNMVEKPNGLGRLHVAPLRQTPHPHQRRSGRAGGVRRRDRPRRQRKGPCHGGTPEAGASRRHRGRHPRLPQPVAYLRSPGHIAGETPFSPSGIGSTASRDRDPGAPHRRDPRPVRRRVRPRHRGRGAAQRPDRGRGHRHPRGDGLPHLHDRLYPRVLLPGRARQNGSTHPRRKTPRTPLPGGSVGIAEAQTGMYPVDSPGGWQIIGRTPLRLFAPERENPFLYEAGDRIRFMPVTGEEYERIRAKEGS